jgi:hypothetical protein
MIKRKWTDAISVGLKLEESISWKLFPANILIKSQVSKIILTLKFRIILDHS